VATRAGLEIFLTEDRKPNARSRQAEGGGRGLVPAPARLAHLHPMVAALPSFPTSSRPAAGEPDGTFVELA
jgi:hypothetical protein